jgi:acetyl-CoA acetyltransferase
MAAAVNAARAAHAGEGDFFIAGGVEQMTRAPWVISKTSTAFGRDAQMFDSSFGWRFIHPKMKEMYGVDAMGETAENLAELYSITREDQDRFAMWSQQKAARATERLAMEIAPIAIPQKKGDPIVFASDEFIKPSTTMEALTKLKPFRSAVKPELTVTKPLPNAPLVTEPAVPVEAIPALTKPPETVVPPLCVLAPDKVTVPPAALTVNKLAPETPRRIALFIGCW